LAVSRPHVARLSATSLFILAAAACSPSTPPVATALPSSSPYLLVFAGDADEADEDFLAVIDLRPGSVTSGRVLSAVPIGLKASMPHHMEYALPPPGELLFMNAHHHEATLLVDTSDPQHPRVARRLTPPTPFRFTHDYTRLANGNRLVGFLRSEGASPHKGDATSPGGHGGIAEYSATGDLLRTMSAAVEGYAEPIRPYAFAPLPEADRIVTTSAQMMESFSADVIQIWRYSDFKLLHTIAVPPGIAADGKALPGAAKIPFEPRLMPDGSVLFNAYGCGLYRVTDIASDKPSVRHVYTIQVPEPAETDDVRGSCGVPVIAGSYWIMPVGQAHMLVTLDISNPASPREVARFDTATDFNPHWVAADPLSSRLVVGAELGGEQGMLILDLDKASGRLSPAAGIVARNGRAGYVDLATADWPGATGPAWGHAALFMPEPRK
jgi:hypothetical protein